MSDDQELQDLLIDEDFGEVDDQKEVCRETQMISEIKKIVKDQRKDDEGIPVEGTYPYLRVYFKFAEGPFAGRMLSCIFSFHPDMKWMLKQLITACGLPEARPDFRDAIGKRVHHHLGVEKYDGQDRNVIKAPFNAA